MSWPYSTLGWAWQDLVTRDLPGRHRLETLVRWLQCARALLFPSRDFRITEFRAAVINVCNASCIFCCYPQTKMAGKVMSQSLFESAMHYFRGQHHVAFMVMGEPLLDMRLKEKVLALQAQGIKSEFISNGILIQRHADWILENGFAFNCVYFSLPSFDAAEYQEQYGVNKGRQCLDGLWEFLKRNDELGQPVRVRVQLRNRHPRAHYTKSDTFQRFKPFWHGKVSYQFTSIWDNWGGRVSVEKWSNHMRKLARFSTPRIHRPCQNLRCCAVQASGTMRLCGCKFLDTDEDDLVVGRVGDSLEQLNASAKKIWDGFNRGEYPRVCQSCSFYRPE